MRKPWILITLGILLILLLGIWLYLFFGGDEAKENIFNTFGFGETVDVPFFEEPFTEPEVEGRDRLRQLSLRTAIGYVVSGGETATSSQTLYLAEAGTGHVYAIDVKTGEEARVSNITIPMASTATFSSDAAYVLVEGSEDFPSLLSLQGSSSNATSLRINPFSVSFSPLGTLRYAEKTPTGVTASSYNLTSKQTTTLFTLPFREAVIEWGTTNTDPHYAYPKPTEELEGALYQIANGAITRLRPSGFGFSARVSKDGVLYSHINNNVYETFFLEADREPRQFDLPVIPEKCAFSPDAPLILCGAGIPDPSRDFLDAWHRGELYFSDNLLDFSPFSSYSNLVESLSFLADRTIDVTSPLVTPNHFFFINKTDATPWVYETSTVE